MARPNRARRSQLRALALLGALAAAGCGGPDDGSGPLEATQANLSSCSAGTTLQGVDVSSYQDAVNWSSAKAAGITFAFAKATEGETLVDSEFAANWAGMKSAGVVRGAYHFFHPDESATDQANFVVSTVGALGANDLPIVLDFEVLDGVSEATAVAGAETFLQAVTAATGKTAILYMSAEFLSGTYSGLAAYPLWVANYGVSCPGLPSEWSGWAFWQNSDDGNVAGISGGTDTNVFNGSLAQLTAFVAASSSGRPSSLSSTSSGSGSPTTTSSSSGSPTTTSSSSGSPTTTSSSSGSPTPTSSSGGSSGTAATTCALGGQSFAQNTCTETLQCDSGAWIPRSSDPSSCTSGVEADDGCVTDTGTVVALNTCTSSLQCEDGVWVIRSDDASACLSSSPPTSTSCTLNAQTYAQNTCTETLQCDNGTWIARPNDPSSCSSGIEAAGSCLTDTGTVVVQNTCTATLQCDDGVWVARSTDPSSCQ